MKTREVVYGATIKHGNELDGFCEIMYDSDDIRSAADFLCSHIKKEAQDGSNDKLLHGYRGSVAMYNNLNKAQKGLLEALINKRSVDIVWEEAAKLSLWLARIADLYEKEFDREEKAKLNFP